ncbi:MAG: hypothetical protein U0521_23280 [Anaerolineae bacterium]
MMRRAGMHLAELDLSRFCDDIRALDADPRVTIFIFEERILQPEAQECGTVLALPSYLPQTISALDEHPNASAHQQIARQMLAALDA